MNRRNEINVDDLKVHKEAQFGWGVHIKREGGCGVGLTAEGTTVFQECPQGTAVDIQYNGEPINEDFGFKTLNFQGGGVNVSDVDGDTADINVSVVAAPVTDTIANMTMTTSVRAIEDNIVIMNVDGSNKWQMQLNGGWEHGENHIPDGEDAIMSGDNCFSDNRYVQAFGSDCDATGREAFACGNEATASGNRSHAEGNETNATNSRDHAEGQFCNATGNDSHAEGISCDADGSSSHAEGNGTNVSSSNGHSENFDTSVFAANGHASGSEGRVDDRYAKISGDRAYTNNRGEWSHCGGRFTGPRANMNFNGHSQYTHIVISRFIEDNDSDDLYIEGSGSQNQISIDNGTTVTFCATIVARSYDGNALSGVYGGAWKITGLYDRTNPGDSGLDTGFIGTPTITTLHSSDGETVDVIDDGNNIRFRGITLGSSSSFHFVGCVELCAVRNDSIREFD